MKTKLVPDLVVDAVMAVIRTVLKLLTRHEDFSTLSGALGRAKNRVSRFFTDERDLAQKEVVHLVQSRGISPWLFFDLVRLGLPEPTPGEIVRQLCRNPNSREAADPFLDLVGPRLRALAGKPGSGPGGELAALAAVVAEVEELRNVSVLLAKDKLEPALAAAIAELEAAPELLEGGREELAIACGVWATLARLRRRYDDAADMYTLAFGLVEGRSPNKAVPLLRQRASYLISACGFVAYAVEFLEQSGNELRGIGDDEAVAKTLVDKATFNLQLGKANEATSLLRTALTKLSSESWRFRVCAWAHLALCSETASNVAEARQHLAAALGEYGDRQDSYRGHLFWTAARLASLDKSDAEAESFYRNALDLLFEYSQPLNAETVLVDFAAFYVRQGKKEAARALGDRLYKAFRMGRYDSRSAETAAALVRHLTFEAPPLETIKRLREVLDAVGDGYRLPTVQQS